MNTFAQPRPISRERWDRMTRQQQAAAVARDAVFRAQTGQLRPRQGVYTMFRKKVEGDDMIDQALKGGERCVCCALGGAICGLASFEGGISNANGRPAVVGSRLRRLFGETNMDRIESTFEGGYVGGTKPEDELYPDSESARFARRAWWFSNKHRGVKARFIAIWKNVARHKGVFKP